MNKRSRRNIDTKRKNVQFHSKRDVCSFIHFLLHEIFILILGSSLQNSNEFLKLLSQKYIWRKKELRNAVPDRSSFNRSRIPSEIKIPRHPSRTFEGYKPVEPEKSRLGQMCACTRAVQQLIPSKRP